MKDTVFVVPVFDKWLVYAPLHRITALVNRSMVATLKNGHSPDEFKNVGELGQSLSNEPVDVPSPHQGPLCPEFIGLIPTRACNLACVYCGFGASESGHEVMDLSLAVKVVDWTVEHVCRTGQSRFEVHFFGGEPFFAPEVVEVAVHRARFLAARLGLISRFEVATNGFFDENRCRFIGDYFNTVVLSLDGPEEIHNRHRPMKTGAGSFTTVIQNASLLSKSDVELCLRICVTKDTVKDLQHISRWFGETFRPSMIIFEPLQPNAQSESDGLLPPDPWEFATRYIQASSLISSFGITPVYAAASIELLRHSFCPVGRDSLIVSPDGRLSACYLLEQEWKKKGLDLNLGKIDTMGKITLNQSAIERVRNLTTHSSRCLHCLARWHCAGGCHVNHSYPGCAETYDDFCIQTRLITTCRLLEELGDHETVEQLIGHQPSLERLALRTSDCLTDWGKYDD